VFAVLPFSLFFPAAGAANEGIYIITSSLGIYVGQSGNIDGRFTQHVNAGKFTQAEVNAARRILVLGGKVTREIAEQMMIDSYGGIVNLINERNPIGPARFS
jgi:hypothetical protein